MRALAGMAPSRDEGGQATLEYALVGVVLICVIAGVGALWRYVSGGGLAELVHTSGSHALDAVGGVADVLLF